MQTNSDLIEKQTETKSLPATTTKTHTLNKTYTPLNTKVAYFYFVPASQNTAVSMLRTVVGIHFLLSTQHLAELSLLGPLQQKINSSD